MKKQLSQLKSIIRNSQARKLLAYKRHQGLRDSDVFLASYPKSGNTWLRHLLTYVVTGQSTEWRGELSKVSVMVGRHQGLREVLPNQGRLIKTHESYRREYQKSILLVRDGRDVAVSEFHYQKNYSTSFVEYNNDFSVFFQRFLKGTVNGYGAWHEHTTSWLESPISQSNGLLVVRFDDLKNSTFAQLRRVADFLDLEASDTLLRSAIDDTSVTAMKEKERKYWADNNAENPNFVRKGKSGNWQTMMSEKELEQFRAIASPAMTAAGFSV